MENQITTVTQKQLTSYLDTMGLATQLTEKEKQQFLEISIAFGLNPFKREIYCSKYNTQMTIIVGYETYIKRAERSGQLDGWQVVTEGTVKDDTLKAVITIHRKDRKIPFVHEVYYCEYVQKNGQGAVNKFWQKAHTMIKKVAMAQGFRLCFNDELGGMPYTKDELDTIIEDVKYDEVPKVELIETSLPDLTESQCLAMCEAITKGNKETVIAKMKNYTISSEFQTAIDLALKNN
jgi:phage recombination protein Bet